MNDNRIVVVGVGQCVQREFTAEKLASVIDLAVNASSAAITDANVGVAAENWIDSLAWIRTFADSVPQFKTEFGSAINPPRALAKKLGLKPRVAIHSQVGGNSPQGIINELSHRLADGEIKASLVVGGEAIGNEIFAIKNGLKPDWSDSTDGNCESKGLGLEGIFHQTELAHGLMGSAPFSYSLVESALANHLSQTPSQHAQHMANLMAPLVDVARTNPFAMFSDLPSSADLAKRDSLLTSSYHKWLCAREKVNQSAAVVLTTEKYAKELGIPAEQCVYLHRAIDVADLPLIQRETFHHSAALQLASDLLFDGWDSAKRIAHLDIYSCFPCALELAANALKAHVESGAPLSLTGGLPYFGGPGNNYSLHGIAELVSALRKDRWSYGLISANGGVLSKQSMAIYSSEPPEEGWLESAYRGSHKIAPAGIEIVENFEGSVVIETYAYSYKKGKTLFAAVIGRDSNDAGRRCLAVIDDSDPDSLRYFDGRDIIGEFATVKSVDGKNKLTPMQ